MTHARLARRLAGAAAASIALCAVAEAQTTDPVIFSFATVGDTRQDPTGFDPTQTVNPDPTIACQTTGCSITASGSLLAQDLRFLQNTKAWQRIIRTEQARKPKLFFVNGDLIMGYGRATWPTATGAITSLATLKSSDVYKANLQYAYWRGMITPLLETGTMVLPVAGNHETQCSSAVTVNGVYNASTNPTGCYKPASGTGKTAYAENETLWRDNMSDLIGNGQNQFQKITTYTPFGWNGLTAATAPQANDTCPASDPGTGAYGSCGASPAVGSDQSKLSYSFNIKLSNNKILHFAVINTDPTGNDTHAPVNWLTADFAAAKTAGATNFFVFGHKPAFTYDYITANGASGTAVTGAGLDAVTTAPTRADFWKLMGDYNATYFCGHEHITHVEAYPVTGSDGTTKKPVQVLVGAGGSPFDYKAPGSSGVYQEPTLAASGQSQYDRYYGWADVQVHQSGAVTLSMSYFSDAFGPTVTLNPLAGNLQ
jgi:hypothetical protein